jgi:putative ABC transport system ATP-binding protein
MNILALRNISKSYISGGEKQPVLSDLNFDMESGEFISILGQSGSGKSTLMNIMGCLDSPDSGEYILNNNKVAGLSETELARIRNKEIGFIFQQFNLLPRLTALQNVELPLIYSGVPERKRKQAAKEMLSKVGLGAKMKSYPSELSGGQQQRVAIARALVTKPSILLADEPTGALDPKTGLQIMELFSELSRDGKSIVMITHDHKIAGFAQRIAAINNGQLL